MDRKNNDVLVVTGGMPQITALIMGPVSCTGLVNIIQEKDMYGHSHFFDHSSLARDKKIAKARKQMSLAILSRNKAEVTRLSKELTYLGTSW